MGSEYVKLVYVEIPHVTAGALIGSLIFLFVWIILRKSYNYPVFFLIPGMFASAFPDLMYLGAFFINNNFSLSGLTNVGSYNLVYRIFHQGLPNLLVIPITIFGLVLSTRVLNVYFKRNIGYPPKWYVIVGLIALISVWMHLIMDQVGF